MPRAIKGAAVFLALFLFTAGVGAAVASLLIDSQVHSVAIGQSVPVNVALSATGTQTVHLFAGTASGFTTVTVNGHSVMIPVGGSVFEAGSTTMAKGVATINAAVPDDSALVGSTITWVAIVVDDVTGRILVMARTGGPIIEDAIC